MINTEKKISDYIDKLNDGQKPAEHDHSINTPEMEKLMDTVRLIRRMKEPDLPDAGYSKRLAKNVANQLQGKRVGEPNNKIKRMWFTGAGSVAALLLIAVLLNFLVPILGRTNIVYAMEQAYEDISAYHGILEVVEVNGEGKERLQAVREVWANKEGHYFIRELEGTSKGVITVNNGEKKWQIRPDEKQTILFAAFPDPYCFTFELGSEVNEVMNASETEVIGDEVIAERAATILEVTPQGGEAYRIWIDKKTGLPLQRQTTMHNALQYRLTYKEIEFVNAIPAEVMSYQLPEGYAEIDNNPEQIVNDVHEVQMLVGFVPLVPYEIPESYVQDKIAVSTGNVSKITFKTKDLKNTVIVLQGKADGVFEPATNAVLGKIGQNTAEILSPAGDSTGILSGGSYAGMAGISTIRWQKDGYEYAVVGNVSIEELVQFVGGITDDEVVLPQTVSNSAWMPQAQVAVDMEIEENEQKSIDAGHIPWKLDPVFVAHVFANVQACPEGIQGDYPIPYESLKAIYNDGTQAIVEVSGETPVMRVYLEKLVRQDNTGIWTVTGYDPKPASDE